MIEAAQPASTAAKDAGATQRIAVCIATFRRPELLARLLQSIRELELPADIEIEVRVVDNDASGSAESTVGQFSDLTPRYAIEPERNIALARNRAIEFGPADFVPEGATGYEGVFEFQALSVPFTGEMLIGDADSGWGSAHERGQFLVFRSGRLMRIEQAAQRRARKRTTIIAAIVLALAAAGVAAFWLFS